MRHLIVRQFGICEYRNIYTRMVEFNDRRDVDTADEIWCLQHKPVYTLGLAASREHLLQPGAIPVHEVDRGGQVTYHGPGQLIVYTLLDLRRKGITIRDYVRLLESSVINFLAARGIEGARRPGAPGVYVNGDKIAALGIRVRRGSCYHGLAINVDMNTGPFEQINPCGYPDLKVTQLSDLGVGHTVESAARDYLPHLLGLLNYDEIEYTDTGSVQQPGEAA